MRLLDWLFAPRPKDPALTPAARAVIHEADHQADVAWDVVNEARRARGVPPIYPAHPFRPRDLIDPREGKERG